MNYPIMSFLMCVRVRTDLTNPNVRDIVKFFRDITNIIYTDDRKKVEFLIKFDNDDTYASKAWSQIKDSPFKITPFYYSRGEGLYSAHENYTFLMSRVHKYSKFIGICGDDSILAHFSKDVLPFLEENIDNNYFLGSNGKEMCQTDILARLNGYKIARINDALSLNGLIESYPVLSKKVLEIMGGFGFHYNVDTWIALINCILYNKYKIVIAKHFPRQTFIRENTQWKDVVRDPWHIIENGIYKGYKTNWNQDMEDLPDYIRLAEQVAKNIYLNIKEDGLLKEYRNRLP